MLSHYVKEANCVPVRVGGWHDHAHVLCGLARTVTVADLVETIKGETLKWTKDRDGGWANFHWQHGYGAFSVSQSLLDRVAAYIDRQPEHHRRTTFQEEFRRSVKNTTCRSMNGTRGTDR